MKNKIELIMAMLIFGTIGIFVRNISLPSSIIAMFRGIIGTAVLFIVLVLKGKKRNEYVRSIKANAIYLIISGVAIGVNWIFLFEAYKYTTIATATLCYYLAPVFVMLASPFVLREKISKRKAAAITLAMLGMVLVVDISGLAGGIENGLTGIIYAILAAILYASVMLTNKKMKNIDAVLQTTIQLFIASIAISIYVMTTQSITCLHINGKEWILLIVVGVIHTGIAYLLYFAVMAKLRAQVVALYSYIDPASAIILSAIILREDMGLQKIIGAVIVLGALIFAEIKDN